MKRWLFCVFLLGDMVHAAPYTPAEDSQVIERLTLQGTASHQALQRMRTALSASPQNLPLATELARRYIEIARSTSDPRYLGYAQAALSPWWSQSQPPAEVRILRASIMQSQHQFASALTDLEAVLNANPYHAQAWLTRATILQVQGRYQQARESCLKLSGITAELIVATCMAGVTSLNGQAQRSYALLESSIKRSPAADPGIRLWAMTLLAEIAARLGKHEAAEQHFRAALELDPADSYLLGAYADFLIDQSRHEEVLALLENHLRNDGLLLRYALALQQQRPSAVTQHVATLASRFNAAMRRGDTVHQREHARFELQLRNNPEMALQIAEENWAVQKEPADARIFLEAAIASKNKEKMKPVLAWMKQTGLEDSALEALAEKAERAT